MSDLFTTLPMAIALIRVTMDDVKRATEARTAAAHAG
jgi:hypothetical protein